jgi:hypothetical protein
LFPVAISVGFAARLIILIIHMKWLENGILPNYTESEELARLFTAMFLVVSGWELYHRDVDRFPLEKSYRFIIDVMIKVLTIIFLYSSWNAVLRFVSFLTIFSLYVVWDAFSIREYPDCYDVKRPAHLGRIVSVYWSGLWNGTRRGPITYLSWFIYFAVIPMLSWCVFKGQGHQAFVSAFSSFWAPSSCVSTSPTVVCLPTTTVGRPSTALAAIVAFMGREVGGFDFNSCMHPP